MIVSSISLGNSTNVRNNKMGLIDVRVNAVFFSQEATNLLKIQLFLSAV